MSVNSFFGFNGRIAREVGELPAVILHNIVHWCDVNKANNRNKVDGRYWTYNSVKAYGELFFFATERRIRTALEKLIEDGYLYADCFNKDKRDRTLWYTITEKTEAIYQCSKQHLTPASNDSDTAVKCIYKDTDINTNINTDAEATAERIDYKKIHTYFNETTNGVFGNIIYPFSETRKGAIRARVKEYGIDAVIKVIDKANESDFLKGENNTKFKATFDWLMTPTYFPRTLEGNYDNNEKQKSKPININSYSDYD